MGTLNKFGVPLDGGKQGPMLQPKMKNRWRVRFLNFGTVGNQATPVTVNAQSVTKPSLTQDIQEVHAYNSKAYYAGKQTWGESEITIRDDVSNTATRQIAAQIQRQLDHFNQTGYRSATDYKFTTIIEVMDGGNTAVLEQWVLEGCFLSQVNYGDMDYTDNGAAQTIQITIRPDNCTQFDEFGNPLMISPAADPQGRTL